MKTLILVRHGETEKNVNKNLHSTNDPELLNETGRKQIKQTATKLKEYSPTKVYCSNEPRATESGEIIANSLGIPLQKIEGMQERNWGEFTGQSWEEVKKVLDPMTLEERYDYVPANGESWRTFETRLIQTIERIIEDNEGSIVVVTHGGAIRALMPFLLNVPKEESFKYDPDNASLTIFEVTNSGFKKVAVNETFHLN